MDCLWTVPRWWSVTRKDDKPSLLTRETVHPRMDCWWIVNTYKRNCSSQNGLFVDRHYLQEKLFVPEWIVCGPYDTGGLWLGKTTNCHYLQEKLFIPEWIVCGSSLLTRETVHPRMDCLWIVNTYKRNCSSQNGLFVDRTTLCDWGGVSIKMTNRHYLQEKLFVPEWIVCGSSILTRETVRPRMDCLWTVRHWWSVTGKDDKPSVLTRETVHPRMDCLWIVNTYKRNCSSQNGLFVDRHYLQEKLFIPERIVCGPSILTRETVHPRMDCLWIVTTYKRNCSSQNGLFVDRHYLQEKLFVPEWIVCGSSLLTRETARPRTDCLWIVTTYKRNCSSQNGLFVDRHYLQEKLFVPEWIVCGSSLLTRETVRPRMDCLWIVTTYKRNCSSQNGLFVDRQYLQEKLFVPERIVCGSSLLTRETVHPRMDCLWTVTTYKRNCSSQNGLFVDRTTLVVCDWERRQTVTTYKRNCSSQNGLFVDRQYLQEKLFIPEWIVCGPLKLFVPEWIVCGPSLLTRETVRPRIDCFWIVNTYKRNCSSQNGLFVDRHYLQEKLFVPEWIVSGVSILTRETVRPRMDCLWIVTTYKRNCSSQNGLFVDRHYLQEKLFVPEWIVCGSSILTRETVHPRMDCLWTVNTYKRNCSSQNGLFVDRHYLQEKLFVPEWIVCGPSILTRETVRPRMDCLWTVWHWWSVTGKDDKPSLLTRETVRPRMDCMWIVTTYKRNCSSQNGLFVDRQYLQEKLFIPEWIVCGPSILTRETVRPRMDCWWTVQRWWSVTGQACP